MKYHEDIKITVWERRYWEFPDNVAEEDVLEGISNLDSPDYAEYLGETEQRMTVEENNGFATREIYNDKDELISANGKV